MVQEVVSRSIRSKQMTEQTFEGGSEEEPPASLSASGMMTVVCCRQKAVVILEHLELRPVVHSETRR